MKKRNEKKISLEKLIIAKINGIELKGVQGGSSDTLDPDGFTLPISHREVPHAPGSCDSQPL